MAKDKIQDPRTIKIKRAVISVSDKEGIEEFAKKLHEFGVEILSTGGTAKALSAAGIPVKDVSDHTGFPEIMDGRVKTLHPKIHGGDMVFIIAAFWPGAMMKTMSKPWKKTRLLTST